MNLLKSELIWCTAQPLQMQKMPLSVRKSAGAREGSVDELLEQVGLARAALDDAVEVALEEQHRLHVVERQHLARVGAKGRARDRARGKLFELILRLPSLCWVFLMISVRSFAPRGRTERALSRRPQDGQRRSATEIWPCSS